MVAVLSAIVFFSLGAALGFWYKRRMNLQEKDNVAWIAQNLMMMYLIRDEMYLGQFKKWARSAQAEQYATLVENHLDGKLWIMPIQNQQTMAEMIKQMFPQGEVQ